jgi:hypothetical protein
MLKSIMLVGVAATAVTAAPVRADLLLNGGFEDGPPGPVTIIGPGTDFPGWGIGGHGVQHVRAAAGWLAPSSGDAFVVLENNGNPASVLQVVALNVGTRYRMSVDVTPIGTGQPPGRLMLTLNDTVVGQALVEWTNPLGSNLADWRTRTFEFTAGSTSESLALSSVRTTTSYRGLAIDNVSLTVVPTPGAGTALLIGVLAHIRRRR